MSRPKVVDTPEFQDAVAAAAAAAAEKIVAEKMAAINEKLSAFGGAESAPAVSDVNPADALGQILEKLSVNLQALNNQGQRNKPLSPAEIAKREAAQNRLVDLLAAAREKPQAEWPKYQLTSKVYLMERFIEPFYKRDSKGPATRTEIAWTGVPNDAMVPVTDDAKAIFNAWRETTGGQTVLIPTADNRPLYVTAAGLVVKGDPPKRQTVAAEPASPDSVAVANDPNQPEVAVLGTIAKKARTNAIQGVQ